MARKFLVMSIEMPTPLSEGGRIADYYFIRSLQELGEVTFLTMEESANPLVNMESSVKLLPRVEIRPPSSHRIHIRKDIPKLLKTLVNMTIRGLPYFVAKFISAEHGAALRCLLREQKFDVVVFARGVRLGFYLPIIRNMSPDTRIILIEHDNEVSLVREYIRSNVRSRFLRLILGFEAFRLGRYRNSLYRHADLVAAISETDRRELASSCPTARICYLPVPTEIPAPTSHGDPAAHSQETPTIIMVGSYTWQPNRDGLTWLLTKVFPLLENRQMPFRLEVIGKNGDGIGRELGLENNARILFHGFVDDLEAIYARASVLVIPVVSGSGIRIKLLEGLKTGIPVVTTHATAAALRLEDGNQVSVADTPELFADKVAHLLGNWQEGREMAARGTRFLMEHHSIPKVAMRLAHHLNLATN